MLQTFRTRLGQSLTGSLQPAVAQKVRRNLTVELYSALAFGVFQAATIAFIPVILRRSGASPSMLAIYTSTQFVGSVLTAFSIVLMRRRRTMSIILSSWVASRTLMALFAFVVQPIWMVVLSTLFWLLEAFPSPGYVRILQSIYPDDVRGKMMSLVRMGRILSMVAAAPLAGWALDHWGYQALFPVGAFMGLLSVFFFARLEVNEPPLAPRQTRTLAELRQILREDKRFSYFLTAFSVYGTGTLMSWTLYPLVQVDRLGLSYSDLGWLGLVQSLFWFLSYAFWGRIVDRAGGVAVLRGNAMVALFLPLLYANANSFGMLIPAFVIQGVISAGWDMGLINAGIQLAKPDQISEYAAVQSTVVGVRGILVPHIGIGLIALGVPMNGVFVLSALLMAVSVWLLGRVQVVTPQEPAFAERRHLRYRWPMRFRLPRF